MKIRDNIIILVKLRQGVNCLGSLWSEKCVRGSSPSMPVPSAYISGVRHNRPERFDYCGVFGSGIAVI
jgi:hypothetical protein